MNQHIYSIAADFGGRIYPDSLQSGLPAGSYINTSGDECVVHTSLDKTSTDTLVAANSLAGVKAAKIAAIDARTEELISLGYTFAGNRFSLSIHAQTTLLGLDMTRNDPAMVYPIEFNTLDDGGVQILNNATDAHNLYLTAVGTVRAHRDSGTAYKSLVRAATTLAEVDAVVDTR